MTPCKDLEAVLPTYLDGELDPNDQLSFDHHVADCSGCRERVAKERAYLDRVRALLAPPPAPQDLEARVRGLLDREDAAAARSIRARGWGWLQATAGVAAAAALALFAYSQLTLGEGGRGSESRAMTVARQVASGHFDDAPVRRGSPHELSVAAQQYLQIPVDAPELRQIGVQPKGWQERTLDGRPAARFVYEDVPDGQGKLHQMAVHVMDARNLDVRGSERFELGGRELWITRLSGVSTVSFKDSRGRGYVFSSDMAPADLAVLVFSVASGLP